MRIHCILIAAGVMSGFMGLANAAVPVPELKVDANPLGNVELAQVQGGRGLNDLLFDIHPLLELTQAYSSHRNIIVNIGTCTFAGDCFSTMGVTVNSQ